MRHVAGHVPVDVFLRFRLSRARIYSERVVVMVLLIVTEYVSVGGDVHCLVVVRFVLFALLDLDPQCG